MEIPRKQIDFARRLGASERPGSRKLRDVNIPASYDAWRSPKRRKNKWDVFGLGNLFVCYFWWTLEDLDDFKYQDQFPLEILFQMYGFSVPFNPRNSFLDVAHILSVW